MIDLHWTDEVAAEMAAEGVREGWYLFDDFGSRVAGPYASKQGAEQSRFTPGEIALEWRDGSLL